MLEIILAVIPAFVLGVIVTAVFAVKKINQLEASYKKQEKINFHRDFKAGYDEGIWEGMRRERLAKLKNKENASV